MEAKKFKRVVLKLSGEALAGSQGYGIDTTTVEHIARQVVEVNKLGIQAAIVVGGGNIWRGLSGSAKGMDRVSADYMGMLATVMNALALQDALENFGIATRVQTVYSPSGYSSYGKGTGRNFWRRNRKSLFFYGYDRRIAGSGN